MKRYSNIKYSVTLEEMRDIAEKFLGMNDEMNIPNKRALVEDGKRAKHNIDSIKKYIQ